MQVIVLSGVNQGIIQDPHNHPHPTYCLSKYNVSYKI